MENDPSGPALFSGLRTDSPHAFVRSGTIAELHSDFNQAGQVDFSEAQRAARTQRPGSILLPIFYSDLIEEDFVEAELLTPVCIRPSGRQNALPDEPLELACMQNDDRARVALYTPRSSALEHVYGSHAADDPGAQEGPDADRVPIRGTDHPTGTDLLMCATTLAGDPRRPGPVGQPPQAAVHAPAPIHPGEVRLRLGRRQGDEPSSKQRRTESPATDDVALFQIAPLLLQSNLAPTRRLYVVNGMTDDAGATDNHSFVYDVMEACWAAFGPDAPFDRASDRLFAASSSDMLKKEHTVAPGQCLLSPKTMYLIDGRQYKHDNECDAPPDLWIQDQMEIGYCSAPGGRAVNVALHCKRERPLSDFVTGELEGTDERVFAFNGLFASEPEQEGTDFGGNIAVSPPVPQNTEAENTLQAGPPVRAHPPAPHGKIILGDCYNKNRYGNGVVHDETRTFLQAQDIQPLIPINTSWLETGHVDEILTFVPTPNAQNDSSATLVMACPDVMETLLKATRNQSTEAERTHVHRGRFKTHVISSNLIGGYDEMSVETLCKPGIKGLNQNIQTQFLDPIEYRLCHCTGLAPTDVFPLPVYFKYASPTQDGQSWGRKQATARTPNVVNMQVLKADRETHLLLPRPCGPRLPPDTAETVVRSVLEHIGWDDTDVCLPQDRKDNRSGFPFWAWPDLHPQTLALFFTRRREDGTLLPKADRRQLIDVIKQEQDFDALPTHLQGAARNTQEAILQANRGDNGAPPLN